MRTLSLRKCANLPIEQHLVDETSLVNVSEEFGKNVQLNKQIVVVFAPCQNLINLIQLYRLIE